jgi:hypothetical protein
MGRYLPATEVVLLGKLGRNEVFVYATMEYLFLRQWASAHCLPEINL